MACISLSQFANGNLALACLNDKNNPSLEFTSAAGNNYFGSPRTLGSQTGTGLAIQFFNGQLFLVWSGEDKIIRLSSTTDGISFSPVIQIGQTITSKLAPTLAVFNDRLYLGWTGLDQNIYIMSSTDGESFENFAQVGSTVTSKVGPSLVAFNGELYIAWSGLDQNIYVMSSSDGKTFGDFNKVGTTITSKLTPALATYNENLYLVWSGLDQYIYVVSSTDGKAFGGFTKVGSTITSKVAPALAISNAELTLAWIGVNGLVYTVSSTDGQSFGNFNIISDQNMSPVLAWGCEITGTTNSSKKQYQYSERAIDVCLQCSRLSPSTTLTPAISTYNLLGATLQEVSIQAQKAYNFIKKRGATSNYNKNYIKALENACESLLAWYHDLYGVSNNNQIAMETYNAIACFLIYIQDPFNVKKDPPLTNPFE